MPNAEDRYQILKIHLDDIENHSISDDDLKSISKAASGFVSSDLAQIVRNSHLLALKFNNGVLTRKYLEESIIEAKPLSI